MLITKNPKTYEELAQIPTPEETRYYAPVSFTDHIDMIKEAYWRRYKLEPISEAYGTNKANSQVFGSIDYSFFEAGGLVYSHVFRNSHNKSISCWNGGGLNNAMVCDNLQINGEHMVKARKHTWGVHADLRELIDEVAAKAEHRFSEMLREKEDMEIYPLTQVAGYRILGEAIGCKAINPTVANVAFEDWRNPRHEEFGDKNLYNLYQGVTEGLKLVSPASRLGNQTRAHHFFRSKLYS